MTDIPSIAAELADAMPSPTPPSVSIVYGTVVSAGTSTLDVRIGGSVVAGVCMTTACSGAKPGQRAMLIGAPPLWTAVGILA